MRIEVKYSTSQGPHVVNISLDEINHMFNSGQLTVTQDTPTGTKTITITGTSEELSRMAQVLQSQATG